MLSAMNTPQVLTSNYNRAKEILALVREFSPDAQLIYDPSLDPQPDVPGAVFDEEAGFTAKPVPSNAKSTEEGAFMIYGHVQQPDLAIPSAAYRQNGSPYTLDGRIRCVFNENVGRLDAERKQLEEKAAAGHPLFNGGIKHGPYLVARGDKVFSDGNKVVVLHWASKPFRERQVEA